MSTQQPTEAIRYRRLGLLLFILAGALGMAELGIMSRGGEWVSYTQLGRLNFFYPLALLAGVMIAPWLRLSLKATTTVSIVLAAVPIIGIGAALLTLPRSEVFVVVAVLWPLSGVAAGILDNAQSSQAMVYSTRGRSDAVAMLAARHGGTLAASGFSTAAVALHMLPGWQYAILGAVLLLPALLTLKAPNVERPPVTEEAGSVGTEEARPAGTQSAWVLVLMGFLMMAAVLPVSVTWSWAEPLMKELHTGPQLASWTLTGFVVAQGIACFVYFKRSERKQARGLVLGGLWIAAVGVALLVAAVVQVHEHYVPIAVGQAFAAAGMAAFGWGVGPLPMVVMIRVGALPLKLDMSHRNSRTVIIQCLLVAIGNLVFGQVAAGLTAFDAYAVTAALCVGALMLCMPLLSPKPHKLASV